MTQTQAQIVAQYLQDHGIKVIRTTEPDELEDGMVEITDKLHVQIPLFGWGFNTVRQVDDETFLFGKSRAHLGEILDDVKAQL